MTRQVSNLFKSGMGYTSERWRTSPTIEGIRALDPDVPLVTNEADAVLLLTERSAFDLPELINHEKVGLSTRLGDGTEDADLAIQQGGALILFDTIGRQLRDLYGGGADERLAGLTGSLCIYAEFSDGTIFFYSQSGIESC